MKVHNLKEDVVVSIQ